MPVKLQLDIDEKTWDDVKRWKIDYGKETMNDAVVDLIKRGLRKV